MNCPAMRGMDAKEWNASFTEGIRKCIMGEDNMECCPYRTDTECKNTLRQDTGNCMICLMGMLCDEVGLNTSAIMNMSIDRTEREMRQ